MSCGVQECRIQTPPPRAYRVFFVLPHSRSTTFTSFPAVWFIKVTLWPTDRKCSSRTLASSALVFQDSLRRIQPLATLVDICFKFSVPPVVQNSSIRAHLTQRIMARRPAQFSPHVVRQLAILCEL